MSNLIVARLGGALVGLGLVLVVSLSYFDGGLIPASWHFAAWIGAVGLMIVGVVVVLTQAISRR